MNTRSSVVSGRGPVWLPLTALAVSILLGGCEIGAVWHSSPASQALWKDLARRSGLITGVDACRSYTYGDEFFDWRIDTELPAGEGKEDKKDR